MGTEKNLDKRTNSGIRAALRPAFAAALAVSQFTSRRSGILTPNVAIVALGALVALGGVWLWAEAARHLRRAQTAQIVATTGPYRVIRHPVYVSMYLISIGLGLMFFAWLWFVVLLVFAPFWWLEAKAEEREMAELYGEAYAEYRRRTAMWLPGIW